MTIQGNFAHLKLSTIAQLLALNTAQLRNNDLVYVENYAIDGDGGGGEFVWDSSNTDEEDLGLIFQVSGVATGRWLRTIDQTHMNIAWFGAKIDGATDDTTAVQSAINSASKSVGSRNGIGKVFFPGGVTVVSHLYLYWDVTNNPGFNDGSTQDQQGRIVLSGVNASNQRPATAGAVIGASVISGFHATNPLIDINFRTDEHVDNIRFEHISFWANNVSNVIGIQNAAFMYWDNVYVRQNGTGGGIFVDSFFLWEMIDVNIDNKNAGRPVAGTTALNFNQSVTDGSIIDLTRVMIRWFDNGVKLGNDNWENNSHIGRANFTALHTTRMGVNGISLRIGTGCSSVNVTASLLNESGTSNTCVEIGGDSRAVHFAGNWFIGSDKSVIIGKTIIGTGSLFQQSNTTTIRFVANRFTTQADDATLVTIDNTTNNTMNIALENNEFEAGGSTTGVTAIDIIPFGVGKVQAIITGCLFLGPIADEIKNKYLATMFSDKSLSHFRMKNLTHTMFADPPQVVSFDATEVNPGTDEITPAAGHPYATDDPVMLDWPPAPLVGSPAAPLVTDTVYYIIDIGGGTAFKLSLTKGGAAINLTTAGVGDGRVHEYFWKPAVGDIIHNTAPIDRKAIGWRYTTYFDDLTSNDTVERWLETGEMLLPPRIEGSAVNFTIGVGSPKMQIIAPTANGTINLPIAAGWANREYWILNNSAFTLSVRDNAGNPILLLQNSELAWCYNSDGINLFVRQIG